MNNKIYDYRVKTADYFVECGAPKFVRNDINQKMIIRKAIRLRLPNQTCRPVYGAGASCTSPVNSFVERRQCNI